MGFLVYKGGGGDEGLGVSEKVRRGLEGVQGVVERLCGGVKGVKVWVCEWLREEA